MAVIFGTELKDTLTGTNDNDSIFGRGDEDKISGLLGDDILNGELGDDRLFGNDGNDKLFGGDGKDGLYGGIGDDILFGGAGNDSPYARTEQFPAGLYGEAGNDTLFGGDGNDDLNGGVGNDALYGDDGSDSLVGSFGNDFLVGGAGDDSLDGAGVRGIGRFDSESFGRGEIDTLTGGDGVDKFKLFDNDRFDLPVNYDDGNSTSAGLNDYALITDFNKNEDIIQLAKNEVLFPQPTGKPVNYSLGATPEGLPGGTGIFIDTGNEPDELIAILQNSPNSISLSEPYFQFV